MLFRSLDSILEGGRQDKVCWTVDCRAWWCFRKWTVRYADNPDHVADLKWTDLVTWIAIQLARLSKFTNIITTASVHNKEFLESLGATHVVNRKLDHSELIGQIRAISNDPIKVVYDSIGEKDTQDIGFDLVADDGTLLLALFSVIDPKKLATSPNKKVYTIAGPMGQPGYETLDSELFDVLSPLIGSGDIKVSLKIPVLHDNTYYSGNEALTFQTCLVPYSRIFSWWVSCRI